MEKWKAFIGSSKESKEIANIVKEKLNESGKIECQDWTDHFFELNETTYETLCKKAWMFDLGIFVGSKNDSVIEERGERTHKTRDNVIYELGLYTGTLSRHRAFFLVEEGMEIPSDFFGVTIGYYSRKKEENITEFCNNILRILEEENKIFRHSLRTSTSLAVGYYHNFVERVWDAMWDAKKIFVETEGEEEKEYSIGEMEKGLCILLPGKGISRMLDVERSGYRRKNLKKAKIRSSQAGKRDLLVRVDETLLKQGKLFIYDVPTTLDACMETIEMFLGKDYKGLRTDEQELKAREVKEFQRKLQIMAKEKSEKLYNNLRFEYV